MTAHATHRRRAFALIDVIVAAVLLGVGLTVSLGIVGSSISSQTIGRDLQTAAWLADEQLNLVLARGPDAYDRRFPAQGACEAPFQSFRYLLEFSTASASEPYTVRCTIAWTSAGRPQSITIETLIATRASGRAADDPDPVRTPQTPVTRTP